MMHSWEGNLSRRLKINFGKSIPAFKDKGFKDKLLFQWSGRKGFLKIMNANTELPCFIHSGRITSPFLPLGFCFLLFQHGLHSPLLPLTLNGKRGNRAMPGVGGSCHQWIHHTCHSRVPFPQHIRGTSPRDYEVPSADPLCDRSLHRGNEPSAGKAAEKRRQRKITTWREHYKGGTPWAQLIPSSWLPKGIF